MHPPHLRLCCVSADPHREGGTVPLEFLQLQGAEQACAVCRQAGSPRREHTWTLQTQFLLPNAILILLGGDIKEGNQSVMLAKLPLYGRKHQKLRRRSVPY